MNQANEQFFDKTDEDYMNEALELAKNGLYTTLPNPSVGCILVKNNKIIGKGWHHRAGEPHAEVMALRNALENGNEIQGATAYVTLEPCSHYGLTPPCALGLVKAGIKRVVAAMQDPNPDVSGKGFDILKNAGVSVAYGLLSEKAEELNKAFLYEMRHGIPYVTLKYGMSFDARTALSNGLSKWITSPESRKDVQGLRAFNQAILTTESTVHADDPLMNVRYSELPHEIQDRYLEKELRVPLRVIVDPHAKISFTEKLFSVPGKVIVVRPSSSQQILEKDINENVLVLELPCIDRERGHVNLRELMTWLSSKKIRNVLVEAGGNFGAELLKENLVNEMVIYVAPKIMGADAKAAFMLLGFLDMKSIKEFEFSDVARCGPDIRITCHLKEN